MSAGLPVQDLIAEALRQVLHHRRYYGLSSEDADTYATAVVTAIQGATVGQWAELTGGTIERARFDPDGGYYRHAVDAKDEAHLRRYGGTIRSRLIGPWREDPA